MEDFLDIIVATCERSELLLECIASIARECAHFSKRVRVLVVDNGTTETATAVIKEIGPLACEVMVLREPVSGKSRALNRALLHTSAPLVGFLDDDEKIGEGWLGVVEREFQDETTDFIGGPYFLDLATPLPDWVPNEFCAVLGSTGHQPDRVKYRADSGPVLMGGNAVVRRRLLDRVGNFDVNLGPTNSARQRTGEDHDIFLRYLDAGAVGWFVPPLFILHHVPKARLQKSYFRSFVNAHARAQAILDLKRPQAVARVWGIPRYMLGTGLRAFRGIAAREASRRFLAELKVRELFAFVLARAGRKPLSN